jgi:hypothetical protein
MADSCLNFAERETERLNMEIELLQGGIRRHNETKNAWDTIVRNAGIESHAACRDLANSETERLKGEIEAVQEEIRRHIETRDAWDTIMRNAGSESRIYRGATYVRGEDRQWYLQRIQASESNEEELETQGDRRRRKNAASEVNSVWQLIQDACERTFRDSPKRVNLPGSGKEQFQSLGL